MSDDVFVIGGGPRLAVGVTLAMVTGALLALAWRIGGDLAWIAVVPAIALTVPALGLARRYELRLDGTTVVIACGWLLRRHGRVRLDGAELELVPTACLHAVVAHRDHRAFPLATWLSRARCDALVAWLDRAAPGGQWPRRVHVPPPSDR